MPYTELQVTTNFSFLRGGSHPEELVAQAAALGYSAIAITDHNTLAGVVRAHTAAKASGIRLIVGCCLDLQDGPSLLAYPTNIDGYSRLSHLLTIGNLRTEKGQCELYKQDVYAHKEGILFAVVPPAKLNASFDYDDLFKRSLEAYQQNLVGQLYLTATRSYQGDDIKKLYRLAELSECYQIPLLATNDVYYHDGDRRQLQDMLTCIREKRTIYTAGYLLCQNAERFLKPEKEMLRLFRQYPDAISRTQEIMQACQFSLDELKYVYPQEITTEGRSPQEQLAYYVWQGAKEKFGDNIPKKISASIEFELDFMERKNYAAYFLTIYDFVQFAKANKILCQGRGSAANSVICYCLGITSVDPSKFKLLFARFMSDARDEPPDVDVDFEHERREEVMQYIYGKFGRDRAGIVATVTQVHYKGAVRDVAKAMGLSVDMIDLLAGCSGTHDEGVQLQRIREAGLNPDDPHLRKVLELTRQYIGFPRQLGQHTGGFVISQNKLSYLCPILNARMKDRTNIEWNKDDIDALGLLKIDVLALGMLTCIRKCFDLAKQQYNLDLTLANVPQDDPAVYDMICRADTIGVFQIESRAQMSMLPRLKPRCFYDLVIEVAIVRPGPIQGDMVHPYLRRRDGKEPVDYPSEALKDILGRTLGIPLFQEQAMEIAIVAAGFTPAEADALRRSMATFKAQGMVKQFHDKLTRGMLKNGYSQEYAERVFKQLEGFGSYGFPESHAVSFALLVYISSWLKCHYPDLFACGLLNSQPMGFYAPAQLVRDAQDHGVTVRPVDINHSLWDHSLEEKQGRYFALRLGFRQVKGLREEDMHVLVAARKKAFTTLNQLLDAGIPLPALEKLAEADAFRSMGLDRRTAIWEISALADHPKGVFTGQPSESSLEEMEALPAMTTAEQVILDYGSLSLSVKAHPLSFLREALTQQGITPAKDLINLPDGSFVQVAGLVLMRQRPGTASGICFITIEDETGSANLVVFRQLFDQYRKEILQARLLQVTGKLQREGTVIHVVVQRCVNASSLLRQLVGPASKEPPAFPLCRSDEQDGALHAPGGNRDAAKKMIQGNLFASRDFK
ncbi:error-prone DNA polymerase [Flavihumibacter sp. CACIAM 22H1]|uniref:error-prone DNA polymerase n=1 Tax=Flavihumibacter sp. CACIAM 22H1 TaxID=1812911 RepID=UPI0007A8D134|nr:error-prone DNA polymerase [Flavihumibacter sp. CACIAM 22H1]KYP14039.1 MAG: error-prone DNA polymerase [Flavihumibacter sp. CACIAM 22H1]